MIIKCITNSKFDLPEDLAQNFSNPIISTTIEKGYEYNVYGMTIFYDYVWYFIDNGINNYPMWYSSPLFEILDKRISKYWIYNFKKGENKIKTVNFWSFPEWANDPYGFYDALLDSEEAEVKIYQKYKLLMDLEYPNSHIPIKAEKLEDNWLMCPLCIDAWQTNSIVGMVVCPKCNTQMHNPNYFELFHDSV